ncbi:MAG: TonB-dependent receptor [Vicingaceae bacterium]
MRLRVLIFLFSMVSTGGLMAQESATLSGCIADEFGNAIEGANVAVIGESSGQITDEKGCFKLKIRGGGDITVGISHISYSVVRQVYSIPAGGNKEVNITLKASSRELNTVTIKDGSADKTTMEKIDPKLISELPNPSGSIESILKTLPGVVSTNELSSTYSVRGGNFDENLIYVNNIEIYRPQLYSNGQQEGLSFVNTKMVSDLSFSAGGFEAKYGDKMSSVLSVNYKKPYSNAASVELSLLGLDAHVEGSPGNHRFTYLLGLRHRRNNYLLNSLDTKGEYQPVFTDFQTYLTYDLTERWEISALATITNNKFRFTPDVRETEFGTFQQSLQLTVFFDGQEVSQFETYFGALTNTFELSDHHKMRLILSGVRSFEDETADIQGQYYIDELDRDLDNVGNVAFNRGIGTYLDHARNYLTVEWLNAQLIDQIKMGNHQVEWGLQYRGEFIQDQLSEWVLLDSAGFSLPANGGNPGGMVDRTTELNISERIRSGNEVNSYRASVYVQDGITWESETSSNKSLVLGARLAYWSFNDERIFSPRATFTITPKWKRRYRFQLSSGVYQQQPFYREIRNLQGDINQDIRSQRSVHLIAGSHYYFTAWGRPFKFSSEIYYKWMDDLVPYIIDNVRVRYFGTNNSKGYATGVDFKINGEFVKNAESWFSLSLMKTEEDIQDDFFIDESGNLVEPGFIPRPTDQTLNFSLFFQDYLPNNPSFKFNLTLHYATGLAFGPPNSPKYQHTLRIPPYRRVDIGMSKQLLSEEKVLPEGNIFRGFKSIWVSLEVFNLLQINNTISYIWVKDVSNTVFGVPNYLTGRLVNLKLAANF